MVHLVGQASLEDLEEDPLGPLVVVGIGGRDLALPVVGEPQGLELQGPSNRHRHRTDTGASASDPWQPELQGPRHRCRLRRYWSLSFWSLAAAPEGRISGRPGARRHFRQGANFARRPCEDAAEHGQRRTWLRKRSMLRCVVILGCVPVSMAYCSAGRPKASQPIGCSTLYPFMRLCRATMSVAV